MISDFHESKFGRCPFCCAPRDPTLVNLQELTVVSRVINVNLSIIYQDRVGHGKGVNKYKYSACHHDAVKE